MPDLKFRLMSLGAKAVEWKHKGGNILSEIRMQPVAGIGDMPESIPPSPPIILYVDPKALKFMARGAQLDIAVSCYEKPVAKPTASEDALAKKAWKEITGLRKNKARIEANLKKIKARLTDYQGIISAKGGQVNNMSGPQQEEYHALAGQKEYLTNEAGKCEAQAKELEGALPAGWGASAAKKPEPKKPEPDKPEPEKAKPKKSKASTKKKATKKKKKKKKKS